MGEGRTLWILTRGGGCYRALAPGWYGIAPSGLTLSTPRFGCKPRKLKINGCLARNAGYPACGFTGLSSPVPPESGDWKVALTRRLESLRYIVCGGQSCVSVTRSTA